METVEEYQHTDTTTDVDLSCFVTRKGDASITRPLLQEHPKHNSYIPQQCSTKHPLFPFQKNSLTIQVNKSH